ncbi:MAG TPA: hypothetical protein VK806_08790 [Bacteroidia bacterium]|nr:hypothetical protein [Bacteroidia bacterium]
MKCTLGAFFIFLLSFGCSAQNQLTIPGIRILLQGHWASIQDSNYTWTVTGDNLIESKGKYTRPQSYDYTIVNETCDPQVDKRANGKSSSGFYIDESSTINGMEFCNMVVTMTKDTLSLLSVDGHVTFKKKQ